MNRILVLMSTYNGERYIRQQIDSILKQKNVQVDIYVRDDGSTDSTLSILEYYSSHCNLKYYAGRNLRPARSFMELIQKAPKYNYYALADQDDVWVEDKLSKAISMIEGISGPALYYHGMEIVDKDLNKIGYYYRPERYSTSLINSCLFGDEIAGCTMVFNQRLIEIINQYKPDYLTMHDGWIHRVCLGMEGTVIGDPTPLIQYRQHESNVVGMKKQSALENLKTSNTNKNKFSGLASQLLAGYGKNMPQKSRTYLEEISDYKHHKFHIITMGILSSATVYEKMKLVYKVFTNRL